MKYLKFHFFLLMVFTFFRCEVPTPYGDLYVLTRDETGNLIQGCDVILYGSEEDFTNEINAIQGPVTTDDNGRAFFLNLKKGTYYVSAKYIDSNGVEKNNLLVSTSVDVLASEIGYRNSITVIIWNSFISNMSSKEGKHWEYSKFIDITTGLEKPIPECLQDDQLVFFRNGNFEYISENLNCDDTIDDNFTGTFSPVSNGSFIIIKDSEDRQRFGLYVVSVTNNQMIVQYGSDFIYYTTVNN